MKLNDTHSNNAVMTSEIASRDKHCVFLSGQSWFAVPAISVREITIAPGLVAVPECHRSLAGLCHLRSEFVPVIKLGSLLDVEGDDCQRHNKLMVIEGRSPWALLIAEAAALESLDTLVTPDARLDDGSQSLVMGTAMFRDQIVRVLDPNVIHRLAKRALDQHWSQFAQPSRSIRSEQGSQL